MKVKIRKSIYPKYCNCCIPAKKFKNKQDKQNHKNKSVKMLRRGRSSTPSIPSNASTNASSKSSSMTHATDETISNCLRIMDIGYGFGQNDQSTVNKFEKRKITATKSAKKAKVAKQGFKFKSSNRDNILNLIEKIGEVNSKEKELQVLLMLTDNHNSEDHILNAPSAFVTMLRNDILKDIENDKEKNQKLAKAFKDIEGLEEIQDPREYADLFNKMLRSPLNDHISRIYLKTFDENHHYNVDKNYLLEEKKKYEEIIKAIDYSIAKKELKVKKLMHKAINETILKIK